MVDTPDTDPVHQAIEVLRAMGRTVLPAEDAPGLYRVDHGPEMTAADVVAARLPQFYASDFPLRTKRESGAAEVLLRPAAEFAISPCARPNAPYAFINTNKIY